jgi:pyroglutamyl-peptidase
VNRRPRLLVTGFGPFPGIPNNPSAVAAARLARSPRWRRLGIDAEALVITTVYAAVAEELLPALAERAPDALLMIGVAGRSRAVRVETRALNRASILLPDAAKKRPARLTLDRAVLVRKTKAHPQRQVVALKRHGFRARTSIDAGPYLCNAGYFAALTQPVPVLFVHIPKPGRGRRKAPGLRLREGWHGQLEAALSGIALDLLRQARLASAAQ